MKIFWPYQVLPANIQDAIQMLHHSDGCIEMVAAKADLNPADPKALADYLQQVGGKDNWVYAVNNILQIEEAMRRRFTFRFVEIFSLPGQIHLYQREAAAIFQVDPIEGLHRLWIHQFFVQDQLGIPNLNRVSLTA